MTPTSEKTRKEAIWRAAERTESQGLSQAPLAPRLAGAILFTIAVALRPFGKLRIGILYHQTMGRFYGNTEYFLRLRAFNPPETREIVRLVAGDRPVNSQILKMVRRRVRVWESPRIRRLLEDIRRYTPDHPVWLDLGSTGWLRGKEWSEPGPQLSFTPEEHRRGQALLRSLGVPEGAPHVCIFAKDRGYSDNPDNRPDPNSYWGTKDFRNCDIRTYIPAARYLAESGVHVFRMGIHTPDECLPEDLHPNIVDYTGRIRATLDDPHFAETYLQATCKFFVGCTSGIYILSSMFGRPVAYTNMIPYGECGRLPHDVFLLKMCRDRNTGKLIPIPALIDMGLDADWLTEDELDELDRKGVEFVDNSSDEILELVREMNQRLDGEWTEAPEDEELQQRYRAISPAICFDGTPFPGRVGAAFLREHENLLV